MSEILSYVYDVNSNLIEEITIDNNEIMKFIEPVFYDEEEFHIYHKVFSESVCRLFVRLNKKFIGYCYIGIKNKELKIPYSSPFSLIYPTRKYTIGNIRYIAKALKEYVKLNNYKKINITLPPDIYSYELVNCLIAVLFSEDFKVKYVDANNYINLENFLCSEVYLGELSYQVRRNFRHAVNCNLFFKEMAIIDFKIAHDIIAVNRKQLSYPLKIPESQMKDLLQMKKLKARCFTVMKEDICIAAAIVFDITSDISQIIYWGDSLDYRDNRPMDFLAIKLFDYYKKLGKKYLDIGPSSENGIINTGLVDFKKSIGCNTCIKISFEWECRLE